MKLLPNRHERSDHEREHKEIKRSIQEIIHGAVTHEGYPAHHTAPVTGAAAKGTKKRSYDAKKRLV